MIHWDNSHTKKKKTKIPQEVLLCYDISLYGRLHEGNLRLIQEKLQQTIGDFHVHVGATTPKEILKQQI